MSISRNLSEIKESIPDHVSLVAVSKTKPNDLIMEAYNAGHRIFGENKVQDMSRKFEELPKDIQWHFIGHLQTNKVKYIAPFVSLIHGIDSLKLLNQVNKEASKLNRKVNCLLQFHIAEEDTKFGLSEDEAIALLNSEEYAEMKHVSICGVMGMASYTDDESQIRKEFRHLHSIFTTIRNRFFDNMESFCEISMGMSGDYPIAIEEGSTMVRIGSSIFGERNY